ncbi:unnamed protein product [Polarella glacialis]|uniref:Uncharacterized protein n=1 Tax=Polarella glacialis TaxID=89957 RepID=A0A813FVS1_POLGL|nr:unnamed protein product [Polarella glacialis]
MSSASETARLLRAAANLSTNDGKREEKQEAPDQYECPHLSNVRRANQHASWTTCSDCDLRTSYTNNSNAKKSWTILEYEVPSSWGSLCPDNAAAESQPNQQIVGFGKYRGLPYVQVRREDQDYYTGVMTMGGRETAKTSKPLKHFAQWLLKRMELVRQRRAQHVYEEEPAGDHAGASGKKGLSKGKSKGKPSSTKPSMSPAELLQQLQALMTKLDQTVKNEKPEDKAEGDVIEISDSENDLGDISDAEWKEVIPLTKPSTAQSSQDVRRPQEVGHLEILLQALRARPKANPETELLVSALLEHIV